MATFVDPLGQYNFSLPLGWAYSVRRSHLITVTFVRVERVDERITVRAVPTHKAGVMDDEWRAETRRKAFRPELKVHDYNLGMKTGLFAYVPEKKDGGISAQAVVVRGSQIDVVIRHENLAGENEERLSPALSMLVRTLVIPTDLSPPLELSDQNLVLERLQRASDYAQREEWEKASKCASEASIMARDTYLRSAHGGAMFPEVPAVVVVIDALILKFRAIADIRLIRDAELLVNRAAFTTQKLPLLSTTRRRAVLKDLQERKEAVEKIQVEVIKTVALDESPGRKTIATRRYESLMHNATVAFSRNHKAAALVSMKIAVDDILMLHANALESIKAGGNEQSLVIQDDELTPETARDLIERFLQGELADALRTLSFIHRSLGELDEARAANRILIDMSQRLSTRAVTAGGHFEPRTGERRHLAATLLDELASQIILGTDETLDVDWNLDQAQLLLDELKEGAALRSRERFLRETWTKMKGQDADLRFDQTPWIRDNVISFLNEDEMGILADWALSPDDWIDNMPYPSAGVPLEVLSKGPAAIIRYAVEHFPEHQAVKFWRATDSDTDEPSLRLAEKIKGEFLDDVNWRRGWASAVLRALDAALPLDHPGLLVGLEFARACLVQPAVLLAAMVETMTDKAQRPLVPDEDITQMAATYTPTYDSPPFGDRIVRRVLTSLDYLVALQELSSTRFEDVLADIDSAVHPDFTRAKMHLDKLPDGFLAGQSIHSGGVGAAIGLLLRHTSEKLEQAGDLETLQSLSSPAIRLSARYGCLVDFLFVVHRVAAGAMRERPPQQALEVIQHVGQAALWLGDAELEATVQHAIGLMLRQGNLRGIPGVIEAIPAFQRAATLYDQLRDTVGAAGALTDLSAMLVGYREPLEKIESGRDWLAYTRRYLTEAMVRLVQHEKHPNSKTYLGEAFQNLARMHLGRDQAASRQAATRCVSLAKSIGFEGLVKRGTETYTLAGGDPKNLATSFLPTAKEIIASTRTEVEKELGDIRLFSNRSGCLNAVLDSLFDHAVRSIEDPQAAAQLIQQIEADRGYTYNRWLSNVEPVTMRRLTEELADDPTQPVLAVYLVTRSGIGLIVLDRDQPARFHLVDVSFEDAGQMVFEHLSALDKNSRLRGGLPWQKFQERFVSDGTKLVAPLEPFVEQGRPICLVPHGVLHGAALHTLGCSPGQEPIGLRTPVFVNPSLTNWMTSRHNTSQSSGAIVATTFPKEELDVFEIDNEITALLSQAIRGEITQPSPHATNLRSISTDPPFQVLHLSSHGMFDPEAVEMGLLMARDGRLPPPRRGNIATIRKHLARPSDIRRQGFAAKLTFLASCVSSRNAEYPGDDLMGLTRAFFASGATDLIAGAWSVISKEVPIFTLRFYAELVQNQSVSHAMLAARREASRIHPSPYFWGVFQHQGANINPLTK
jgi:CHAT domain-containing protein